MSTPKAGSSSSAKKAEEEEETEAFDVNIIPPGQQLVTFHDKKSIGD